MCAAPWAIPRIDVSSSSVSKTRPGTESPLQPVGDVVHAPLARNVLPEDDQLRAAGQLIGEGGVHLAGKGPRVAGRWRPPEGCHRAGRAPGVRRGAPVSAARAATRSGMVRAPAVRRPPQWSSAVGGAPPPRLQRRTRSRSVAHQRAQLRPASRLRSRPGGARCAAAGSRASVASISCSGGRRAPRRCRRGPTAAPSRRWRKAGRRALRTNSIASWPTSHTSSSSPSACQ